LDVRLLSTSGAGVISGDKKSISSVAVGDTLLIDFYGTVTDTTIPADVKLQSVGGTFKSTGGPVFGDLAANGASVLEPYNGTGTPVVYKVVGVGDFAGMGLSNPQNIDLDGDGDKDLGAANGAAAELYAYVRNANLNEGGSEDLGTPVAGGREWKIGQIKFTVTASASGSTLINFDPRRDAGGKFVEPTALFFQGDAKNAGNPSGALTGLTGTIAVGTGITVNGTGVGPTPEWTGAVSNLYSVAGNWNGGVPNAVGAVARFAGGDAGDRLVTVDIAPTLGEIILNNPAAYTITGAGPITMNDGTAGPAKITINAGVHSIATPITVSDPNGLSVTSTAAGATVTLGNVSTGAGTFTVDSNLTTGAVTGTGSTDVKAGRTLTIKANSTGSSQANLTLAGATNAWTSRVDLVNNKLVLKTATQADAEAARDRLSNMAKLGRNPDLGTGQGQWDGANGLVSATAHQGNLDNGIELFGVVVIRNGDPSDLAGLTPQSTFGGIPVDNDDVLVRYSYAGDANADGLVNGDDYTLIDLGFAIGDNRYFAGDFTYDGVINGDDYTIIDLNFAVTGGGNQILSAAAAASVPEPATLGLLACGGLGLLGRRRRRD
jgi:hypothetical protein